MKGMTSVRAKKYNEDGLVAIVVATVVMIILSLITLGFARIMQSEQRQALDRSLSTQAFYAAESAINDVVRQIQDPNPATAYTQDKATCGTDPANRFDGSVDSSVSATYTCLLIDQAPDTLEYTQGSIGLEASKIIPIRAENGSLISQVRIAWEENSSSAPSGNTPIVCPSTTGAVDLPPFSGGTPWNNRIGMLRIDLIRADPPLDRNTLVAHTMSSYLYPCTGAGSIVSTNFSDHNADNQKGQILPVRCVSGAIPRDCEVSINMNNASPQSAPARQFYLRIRSIYRANDVTVRVFDGAGTQQAISGAQVQIDSTGKVNDVLRRIQVRVPVNKSYQIPEYVIQTTDSICKQIQVTPLPTPFADNGACPL